MRAIFISRRAIVASIPLLGLLIGLLLQALGHAAAAGAVWTMATVPVLLTLLVEIFSSLRRGDVGLDIVAAISMAGALALDQTLAAAVVALMYAGGQRLEEYAEGRATREMTTLLARTPRTANRYRDGRLETVAIDAVCAGDRLLVARGDVTPVDGTVAAGLAILDESTITGESRPMKRGPGAAIVSGVTNSGDAFDLLAARSASDSTYAGIVRLVEAARRSKAPMVRIADRFAILFLLVAAAIAGAAWLLSGDAVRALAVFVVATPCPLILAVPVAIVAGVSRAAKAGILIKGGGPLETLARIRALVFDKTGTLTYGRPDIVCVKSRPPFARPELLRFAASLEQASRHGAAQAIVAEAAREGLILSAPADVVETPGQGMEGVVDGRAVIVGEPNFVLMRLNEQAVAAKLQPETAMTGAAVAIAGQLAGEIVLADKLRSETPALLAELRNLGLERLVMATGDRNDVAVETAAHLGLNAIRAQLTPADKIAVVQEEQAYGPVAMIGDGVNDAPALAAADIGVAMGAKGSAASVEAADIVLLVDRLDRIALAIRIARRSRAIALQSVYVGMTLSIAGMVAAAFGLLTPIQGALLQEGIDLAVILNALRALRDDPPR